jgi:uncharacterized membrane protein YGL010W
MQDWLDAYGESHQNPTNKLVHWICVPIIFFTIIGLLSTIPSEFLKDLAPESWSAYVHWGTVVIIFGLIFYLRLSFVMFLGILLWCLFCLWGNARIDASASLPLWQISLGLFVLAWIGQFWGHKIEGKKPSFLQDLQFLLVGPAWLLAFIYQRLGIKY